MNMPTGQLQATQTFADSAREFLPAQQHPGAIDKLANGTSFESRLAGGALWRESLDLLARHVQCVRRKCYAGDLIYRSGDRFDTVFVVVTGLCKEVNLMPDGREQATGLQFKGDWLGFDGILTRRHCCYAVAVQLSEIWAVSYPTLMRACAREPALMQLVLEAISSQLAGSRDAMMVMGTLKGDARVGYFLLQWGRSLQARGQRTDQISICLSRADIASHLGMRAESVSRALTKIAQSGAIEFNEPSRREVSIPSLDALQDFVQCQTEEIHPAMH